MSLLELSLATGRKIRSASLFEENTYAGFLQGRPTRELNNALLARLPNRVKDILGAFPVVTIDPTRRIENMPRETEYLPACWVATLFTSLPLDENMHASGLIVTWFQEEAFPIPSEAVLPGLQALDWERNARDFEY